MAILSLDGASFASAVTQATQPVLVDFWAEWCGPCHMLSPVVESLAEDHPEITFAKVNVDEAPELAQSFQVSAIPTLVLIKDGKVADVSVGVKSKEQLEDFLK
jgi:thioredoxin 1